MLKNCYYQIFKQNCYQHMKTKRPSDYFAISEKFHYSMNIQTFFYKWRKWWCCSIPFTLWRLRNMKKILRLYVKYFTIKNMIITLLLSLLIGSKILLIKYNLMFRYTNCKLQKIFPISVVSLLTLLKT